MAAEFLNESATGQFKMTIDEEKKSVSITKLDPEATATVLDTVMAACDPLFAATPTAHYRQKKDLVVAGE